jgi:folate-binding protein YgfZ
MNSNAYHAMVDGQAWRDCSHFGRFLLRGRDAAALLHHLTTADIKTLKVGQFCDAALLTVKARLLDWLTIARAPEGFFVITSPNRREIFAPHARRFVLFRQDVQIEDVSESTRLFALFGGAPLEGAGVASEEGFWRAPTARLPRGCWAWCNGSEPHEGEGREVDSDTFNVRRVEEGVPVAGLEVTEDFNPWEAGLDGSISLAKGCYNGQEVVARLHSYKKIKQRLRGLRSATPLEAGSTLVNAAGRACGRVTSSVMSPRLGPISLAYVREDAWSDAGFSDGASLVARSEMGDVAPVTAHPLPFAV